VPTISLSHARRSDYVWSGSPQTKRHRLCEGIESKAAASKQSRDGSPTLTSRSRVGRRALASGTTDWRSSWLRNAPDTKSKSCPGPGAETFRRIEAGSDEHVVILDGAGSLPTYPVLAVMIDGFSP
jgi:hypothetical protein